ncbi:hypothetical protein HFP15_28750 [Amycolatopsis sp. K13G38]|uniref:Uncharacterized protein n=1 Tax=Amycolatopsis acididurans TaxID=2724524 RepID=A0ABX1JAS2_9PSEU|nr:hypothetical protein [Amycolatopsis acididurans]
MTAYFGADSLVTVLLTNGYGTSLSQPEWSRAFAVALVAWTIAGTGVGRRERTEPVGGVRDFRGFPRGSGIRGGPGRGAVIVAGAAIDVSLMSGP